MLDVFKSKIKFMKLVLITHIFIESLNDVLSTHAEEIKNLIYLDLVLENKAQAMNLEVNSLQLRSAKRLIRTYLKKEIMCSEDKRIQ